jgi:hypothetical protein
MNQFTAAVLKDQIVTAQKRAARLEKALTEIRATTPDANAWKIANTALTI